MVSRSNKYETYQQKIINPLTIKRYMLVGSYFFTHDSRLLGFITNDMISYDTKYFFLKQGWLKPFIRQWLNVISNRKDTLKYNISICLIVLKIL